MSQYRKAHIWTVDKLDFLEAYIPQFQLATKSALNTYYVDGFAGEGINQIELQQRNGSPLIALNTDKPFSGYYFIEKKKRAYQALEERIQRHPLAERVTLYNDDFNHITGEILPKIPSRAPTFFFLDPEGLELEWNSVVQISKRTKADIFVLVSASGVTRNIDLNTTHETITRFFGDVAWKDELTKFEKGLFPPQTKKFEVFTNLYVQRLNLLGFQHVDHFLIAKNSKNASLHALIFAIKSDKPSAALKIANKVLQNIKARNQISLFKPE
ncbi:MAG: three-Cys-motif partner protein TcmP [Deinococcales bacterium]